MIEAVIFDIDGTLLDSVDLHAQAWQDALRHFGHDHPLGEIRSQIGKGGDQLMPVFLSEAEIEDHGKKLEAYRGEIFKTAYLNQVKAFPKVRDLFERIKADGIKVALASSAKGDELETYKEIAGINGLLEAETSSDDADKSKPHPDIFEAALERLPGIDQAKIVVIGDTPYDAEAAGKAGLRTIGVLCGGFPEDDLRKAGCFAIYGGPDDLLARYDQSPLARS